ncbi:LicD family protein [Sulfitobacter sp. S190]|uniref:LicD family protein n=1 Tax=Sulfitobacter sp. S190 TaxID=2867022 RepID=UPI0021A87E9D|nr:LicD family protein [Sulfitobacter sp. S190]UWR22946.1 LicD family protein [Sulfitobacter sp. S190]
MDDTDLTEKEAIRLKRRAVRRIKEIRQQAFAILGEEGADTQAAGPLWAELKALGKFEGRILYREARVALFVALRLHPKVVVRELRALRRIHTDRGDPAQYDSLSRMIDTHLHPDVLTFHSYSGTSFSHVDTAPVWQNVATVMAWLTKYGYESFLNSGTLLGVTRDGDFIAHDDDVDLAVMVPGTSVNQVARNWQALRETLAAANLLDAEQSSNEVLKTTLTGGFTLDLFPAWVIRSRVYVYPHTNAELTRSQVLPLGTCATTGLAIPRDPEAMLAINYGETWRTPDRLFVFPWRDAFAKFAAFRQATDENQRAAERARLPHKMSA